jgi:hypothetical protein
MTRRNRPPQWRHSSEQFCTDCCWQWAQAPREIHRRLTPPQLTTSFLSFIEYRYEQEFPKSWVTAFKHSHPNEYSATAPGGARKHRRGKVCLMVRSERIQTFILIGIGFVLILLTIGLGINWLTGHEASRSVILTILGGLLLCTSLIWIRAQRPPR